MPHGGPGDAEKKLKDKDKARDVRLVPQGSDHYKDAGRKLSTSVYRNPLICHAPPSFSNQSRGVATGAVCRVQASAAGVRIIVGRAVFPDE